MVFTADKLFQSETDQYLVARLQHSDRYAPGLLYQQYACVLMGVIFRMAGNSRQAEEALNVAMVKTWSQISRFGFSRNRLLTWLFATARQSATEARAGMNSQTKAITEAVEISTHTENGILPQRCRRTALELVYLKGFSGAETANFSIPADQTKAISNITINHPRCPTAP